MFWHTQGSGKSYSMGFLAQKIRRKFAGSPTIVVLTDRDELNRQISETIENCGMLGKTKASQFIASSGTDLVKKLQGNPSLAIGGTSVIIVVGVALETVRALESQMMMRQYKGFLE